MTASKFFMLAAGLLGLAASVSAQNLWATDPDGNRGEATIVTSDLKVTVGPQWVDVEEEIVMRARSWWGSEGPLLIEGTFTPPQGAVIVSCLLWNDDTLLLGKLRGKADAQQKFDSLVPPRPVAYPRDPLLIEQQDETIYGLKLYPVPEGGTRKFRIRYLVPVASQDGAVDLRPILQGAANMELKQWGLQLRGTAQGVKFRQNGVIWPLFVPADRIVYTANGPVSVIWQNSTSVNRAIRGKIASGSWEGEYILYSGSVPDSIANKSTIRSETVFLWRWIQPSEFVVACDDYSQTTCVSGLGYQAINQAQEIGRISDRITSRGGKVGLVADQGLDDSLKVFPIASENATEYIRMRDRLNRVNADYVTWRIPAPAAGSGGAMNLQLARNRERFRTDIRQVASLYSKEAGVIRHLVVVTVGRVPSGGDYLEEPSLTDLPSDVSLTSTNLQGESGYWDYVDGRAVWRQSNLNSGSWPGVDLVSLAARRPGDSTTILENGLKVPMYRSNFAATLTIEAEGGYLSRNVVMEKADDGRYYTTLNVHSKTLGQSIRWSIFDAKGDTLHTWLATPAWQDVKGDSILPRLWGASRDRMSTRLRNATLAPVFGFVDTRYSLLALPSDSVGYDRQTILSDSGVPFLSAKDIFPEVGYNEGKGGSSGSGGTGIGAPRQVAKSLQARWLADGSLRIDIKGLDAQSIEIVDLRGRVVARWSAAQLRGLSVLLWNGQDLTGSRVARGMLIVRATLRGEVRTATITMP